MILSLFALVAHAQTIISIDSIRYSIDFDQINSDLKVPARARVIQQDTNLTGDIIIPSVITYGGRNLDVISIENNAFRKCKINSIVIPAVDYIGRSCFSESLLSSISVPKLGPTEYIGDSCFYECHNLKSIKIHFGYRMPLACFQGCSSLTSLDLTSSSHLKTLEGFCFLGCTSLESIDLPSSVTNIGSWCFSSCINLSSINIPLLVTSLPDYCFSGCMKLTSVNIPPSVTSIGSSCFSYCRTLTSINIPSTVIQIGPNCFYGCRNLNFIEIPNSVTYLGPHCFKGCGLKFISIPSSVTALTEGCFSTCDLDSIHIPFSVTSIGEVSLYGNNFKICYIPASVTSISDAAFMACNKLESIDIPSSVSFIGKGCFKYCHLLRSIKCNWVSPDSIVQGNDFDEDTYANATLYVPSGTKTMYQKTIPWCYFINIREINGETSNENPLMGVSITSNGSVINLSGLSNGETVCFYNISGMLLGTTKVIGDRASFDAKMKGQIIIVKIGENSLKVKM